MPSLRLARLLRDPEPEPRARSRHDLSEASLQEPTRFRRPVAQRLPSRRHGARKGPPRRTLFNASEAVMLPLG
jgi:hypothetical protein